MSAFLVNRRHIDVLVSLALNGPTDQRGMPTTRRDQWDCYRPRWIIGGKLRGVHDDATTYSGEEYSPTDLGRMVWRENLASVQYRYADESDVWMESVELYEYRAPGCRVTVGDGMKALDCYEYQSCEHPEWEASEAHAFCRSLRLRLCSMVPGYSDGPWCWDDSTVADRRTGGAA